MEGGGGGGCSSVNLNYTPTGDQGKISAQPHTLAMYATISYYHYTLRLLFLATT